MLDKWCYELVERDKTFRRAHPEQQAEVIAKALAYGIEVAEAVRKEYVVQGAGEDFVSLVSMFGAKLRLEVRCLSLGHLAEYDEADKEIICYLPVIQQVARQKNLQMQDNVNGYSLLWLCVTHELFHHLEANRFGRTNEVIQLEVPLLRWFSRKASINGIREIAANSFVRRYLDLSFYPVERINN